VEVGGWRYLLAGTGKAAESRQDPTSDIHPRLGFGASEVRCHRRLRMFIFLFASSASGLGLFVVQFLQP